MRDHVHNIATVTAVEPAVLTATTTSAALDLLGFDSATVIVNSGAIVSAGDFTAKLQESDTTTSGDFTDVAAAHLLGSLPASLAASSVAKIGYRGFKRYPFWAEEGWLVPAGRSAIDYSVVLAKIRELIAIFEVREVACDIKFAQPIVGPLIDDGVDVVALQQGWVTQSPALNVLEKAAYDGLLKWDSPVLAWCLDNVAIQQVDSNGNRLMHKGRSRDRIDLASALWMAVSRAAAGESEHWLADPDLDVSKFFADLRG